MLAGFLACGISLPPRPASHVIWLPEAEQIELSSLLRWHGHLRDEPARAGTGAGEEVARRKNNPIE
jgi:hypothetical protein